MCLTEWVYKPMGLTKLYVPVEDLSDITTPSRDKRPNLTETNGPHISKELWESEKALIGRFERIVRYWIKQIHDVLASTSTSKGEQIIFDELQRWTARCYYILLYLLHYYILCSNSQAINYNTIYSSFYFCLGIIT